MAFFTNRRNSIIQTRIKLLTGKNNLSTNSSTESDDSLKLSPILQELNGKKDRVKRFSDLFERQPWLSKFGCPNWWLEEGMLKTPVVNNDSTTNLTLEFNYKCKISSTPISKMKSARRTSLDDLISLERKYIKEIENHTNDLKKKLKSGVGFDPMRIREFDVSVYGNIMELLSLHSTLILPKMLSIERKNGKCLEVFDFLLRMLNENGFYCYVNYKMLEQVTNKCKSQLSHSDYVTFDAFGIFNRYNDCIKAKFDDTEEDERDREKNLCETFGKVTTAFMGLIFEAKQVTHIQQIEKVSLDALFKLYKIRQRKCPEMKGAIIPLIPSRHVKFGYRSPLDIMQLGKLVTTFESSMVAQDISCKYPAKFFIFEKCIIFTDTVKAHTLNYENHFKISEVGFVKSITGNDLVELKNRVHSLIIDEQKFVTIVKNLKANYVEIGASIEFLISTSDLIRLTEIPNDDDAKKSRRCSFIVNS